MDIASGLAAATAALTTVRQLAEIDKSLSQAEIKAKMATLYSDLADVKIALSDARETISELSAQVGKLESWEDEKRFYTLTDAGNGVLVYRFDTADQEQTAHDLCPSCFQAGRKSILQPERVAAYRAEHLKCNVCRLDVITQGMRR